MACPRLEWQGPTREQLQEVSMRSVERMLKDTVADVDKMTDAARATAKGKIEADINRGIQSLYRRKKTRFDAADRLRLKHFEKRRVLESEPLLSQELRKMAAVGGGKFSLAHLQMFNRRGIEELCISITAKHYGERPVFDVVHVRANTIERAFEEEASSQGDVEEEVEVVVPAVVPAVAPGRAVNFIQALQRFTVSRRA